MEKNATEGKLLVVIRVRMYRCTYLYIYFDALSDRRLLQNHVSNRDIMGSTDTMAISEVSANTLDNVSAHTIGSVSQNPSCRAMCGSLASFDACSVITEGISKIWVLFYFVLRENIKILTKMIIFLGFPLLEEYVAENENQSSTNINFRSTSGNK